MRTVTITRNAYKFAELSEAAKERAIERATEWQAEDIPWRDEWMNSIKGFCAEFPVRLDDYSLGPYARNHWSSTCTLDLEVCALRGVRAWKWLINNGYDHAGTGKARTTVIEAAKGTCPYTGFMGDCSPLDPLAAFLRNPDPNQALGNLFNECVTNWARDFVADMEALLEPDAIAAFIECNDWEWNEDGTPF